MFKIIGFVRVPLIDFRLWSLDTQQQGCFVLRPSALFSFYYFSVPQQTKQTLARLMSHYNQEGPVVLIVGGWSPGPLVYLQSALAASPRNAGIIRPRHLPMPPFPGVKWCCHPKVVLAMTTSAIFLWLTCANHATIAWNLLAAVATVISVRLLVAVAVRTSIQVAMQSCLEATRPHDGNIIFLGFSWGGAVSQCENLVDMWRSF